jgi:hypothetical protein
VFRMNFTKVDRDIVYVSYVFLTHVTSVFILMLHIFYTYVTSVLSGCCVCL